ncbi:MAG: metallophosphoesterase family protein, partial [Myxococcaceae bacterium]
MQPWLILSLALAAPDAGTPDAGVIRFAVIGDFGSGDSHETDVARLVKSWSPDFVVTTGDNNYPNGAAATIDEHIGRDWAAFIGEYQGRYGPGSAVNRFWPVPGNHDWRSAGLRPYLEYFHLPGN